jgi:hypothetical protein
MTNYQSQTQSNAQFEIQFDPQDVIRASQPPQLIGWPLQPLNHNLPAVDPAQPADPAQAAQIESLQQENQRLHRQVQKLLDQNQVQMARIQALYDQIEQRDAQIRFQELRRQSQASQIDRDRRRAAVPAPNWEPSPSLSSNDPIGAIDSRPARVKHSRLVKTCLNCLPALVIVAFGYGLLTLVAGLLGATSWAIALIDLGEWLGRVLLAGGLIFTAIAAFSEGW